MMDRTTGGTNSAAYELQGNAARDGCPHCGAATTAVPLRDFGLETGQLCPVHGVVHAANPVATDGGRDETDEDDDCECDGLERSDLECFHCFREQGLDDDGDRVEAARHEHEQIAKAEERAERALERGEWGVGR